MSKRILALSLVVILIFVNAFPLAVYGNISRTSSDLVETLYFYIDQYLPTIKHLMKDIPPQINEFAIEIYPENVSRLKFIQLQLRGEGVELNSLLVKSEGTWEVVKLDLVLNGYRSEEVEQLIQSNGSTLVSSFKRIYEDMKSELADSPYNITVIGFEIYINGVPSAFYVSSTGTLKPAVLSWSSYFSGKIAYFRFVNDFKVIEPLLRKSSISFNITEDEAINIIKDIGGTNVSPKIFKYVLIFNGSLVPAYMSYVSPYSQVVISGISGKPLMSGGETSTPTAPSEAKGNNYYIYGLIGLGIVIVLAVVILGRR